MIILHKICVNNAFTNSAHIDHKGDKRNIKTNSGLFLQQAFHPQIASAKPRPRANCHAHPPPSASIAGPPGRSPTAPTATDTLGQKVGQNETNEMDEKINQAGQVSQVGQE